MAVKTTIYITYGRADDKRNPKPLHTIVDLLESKGYDVWYDHYLKSNIPYQEQLLKNSFECEVFIALLGVGTIESDWVHREIDTARAGDAALIPIIVDDEFTIADLYTFFLEGFNAHWYSQELLAKLPDMIDSAAQDVRNARREKMTKHVEWGTPSTLQKYQADIFMVMPFADEITEVYSNHIKPMVKQELNLTIKRGDDAYSPHDITFEIWSWIYNAKLIIAECTGANPNVFYEIGMAHTLGKSVIFITQNLEDVKFDVQAKRFIVYENTPEGIEKLKQRLKVAIHAILEHE